ncbi:MAG: hypothetical protein AAF483_08140 [Planctomycetota bacterium]
MKIKLSFGVRAGLCCCLVLFAAGCQEDPEVSSDTQHDLGHQHKHIHGKGHDHEHEHDEFKAGAHDHSHSHGHRHGEPLFGGEIVAIGHSHHKDGEQHFHAEVLPVADGKLTMHLLTEEDGEGKSYPVKETEILAYMGLPEDSPTMAQEVAFKPSSESEESSEFVVEIPEYLLGKAIEVVIPKIVLGGERLSFDFKLKGDIATGQPSENDAAKEEASTETANTPAEGSASDESEESSE